MENHQRGWHLACGKRLKVYVSGLEASRSENKFRQYTLASLAAYFGVVEPVQTHVVCIDPRVQWSQFWNIWQNAAIRTFLFRMLTPVRWMLKYVSRGASTKGTY